MNDLVVAEHHAQAGGPLSAAVIKDRVQLMQRVMKDVMKKGTHYDTIPGTDKPTLLKPGAEVLMATFQIAVDPEVLDLSEPDIIRYRVRAVGRSINGAMVGVGVGECSSSEEKYKWRRAVCDEEFDEADEIRKRVKFARSGNGHYKIKQVRTESADVANTVLKMAKKRALVDFTLTALAASDIFAQDLEDMPEELREAGGEKKEVKQPKAKPKPEAKAAEPASAGAINSTQASMIRKKLEKAGKDEPGFCEHFGIKAVEELPMKDINIALKWTEGS